MAEVRRILRMAIALAVSIATGWVFLAVVVTNDPDLRRMLAILLAGDFQSFPIPPLQIGSHVLDMAVTALWMGTIFICVTPVIIVAALGEAAQTRSFLWYGFGTGTLAAAMPSILRVASGMEARLERKFDGAELSWLMLFFAIGSLCGAVYWLFAGRACGSGARNG